MQKITLVLASMACAGHGWRPRTSAERLESSLFVANEHPKLLDSVTILTTRARVSQPCSPLRVLARFLLALNPAIAFNPVCRILGRDNPISQRVVGRPAVLEGWHCSGRRALVTGLGNGLAPSCQFRSSLRSCVPRMGETEPSSQRKWAGLKIGVSAAIGNILQGFNTGVIAAALLFIVPEFGLATNPAIIGLIASSPTMGAVVGTALSSKLCDFFGRQKALLLSSAFYLIGGGLMWWSPMCEVLIGARFIVGIAAGLVSAAVPTYIAECSEPALRGRLSTLPQLCVSSGIMLSYLVGLFSMWQGVPWRRMFGFSLLPAAIQFFAVLSLPESPRWLLSKSKPGKALKALKRLRDVPDECDILEEAMEMQEGLMRESPETGNKKRKRQNRVKEWLRNRIESARNLARIRKRADSPDNLQKMEKELQNEWRVRCAAEELDEEDLEEILEEVGTAEEEEDSMGFRAILRDGSCRRVLIICSLLQLYQQFCGVNAIVYFTPTILKQAGVHALFTARGWTADASAMLATVIAYLPKIPSVLYASTLIDSRGRKWMLMRFIPPLFLSLFVLGSTVGGAGATVDAIKATIAITLFGIFFGMSLGPLPNILSAELFPTPARAAGVSATTTVQWLSNMLVAALFPVATQKFGMQAVLNGFACVCIVAWFTVLLGIRETKGKTLEEITEEEKQAA